MKKLLLILPLSLIISSAWAQNTATDNKMSGTSSLDGRSFKITMIASATNEVKTTSGSQDKSIKNNETDKMGTQETKSDLNNTTVLHFENGTVRSSHTCMKSMDNCPYTISGMGTSTSSGNTEPITFTATCKNASSSSIKKICTWNGTVDGKNISGSLNTTKDDGVSVSYSFTGTETDSKDLGIK